MDDKEMVSLFSGYGYQVCIVDDLPNINVQLASALEWALAEIKKIQKAARSGEPLAKPRWPMLVLRTPKGWSGPKEVDGQIVEGSFKAHQVPLANAKSDDSHLQHLKDWLSHYEIGTLLKDGKPNDSIMRIIPQESSKRLGQVKKTYDPYIGLELPDWREFTVDPNNQESAMKVTGAFLKSAMEKNPQSFRMFSPDELESNKLNAVLEYTGRNFQWDEYSRANGGRVIEILSEHCCQGTWRWRSDKGPFANWQQLSCKDIPSPVASLSSLATSRSLALSRQ